MHELVLLDRIPDTEKVGATRPEHVCDLGLCVTLSGKNITPNWYTTTSNGASGNGRFITSACCHATGPAAPTASA